MQQSHPDLEPASLGEVLDPLEGLVLLPVYIQPVHLQTAHCQLADCKLHTEKGRKVNYVILTVNSPDAGVGRFRGGASDEVDRTPKIWQLGSVNLTHIPGQQFAHLVCSWN